MNLDVKICPGCGLLNPPDENPGTRPGDEDGEFEVWFACKACGFESSSGLPTVLDMSKTEDFCDCNGVNLSAFLRTLLK